MTDEIDDELSRMVQRHLDIDGQTKLGGVNPPSRDDAAAGTMQDAAQGGGTDVPDLITSKPAAAMPMGAAPAKKHDLSRPLSHDFELEALQADAKSKRDASQLGQTVADFAERPTNFLDYAQRLGGGGVSAPPAKDKRWAQDAEEGDRAIADLKERRASDAGMAASSEDSDPNSSTAQTYRMVLEKVSPSTAEQMQGATAKQMRTVAPWLEKLAAENADALKAEMAAKEKARLEVKTDESKGEKLRLEKDHYEQGQANSDRTYGASMANAEATRGLANASFGLRQSGEQRDASKYAAETEEKAKGKPLTDGTLTEMADAQTAISALDDLGAKFGELEMSGPMAKASSLLPDAVGGLLGTDASKYNAAALLSMQGVGKIMEGGKLAAGDETKYRSMLPKGGESLVLAQQKIQAAKAFLQTLLDKRTTILRAAGRNVPDMGAAKPTSAVKTMKLPSGEIVEVE